MAERRPSPTRAPGQHTGIIFALVFLAVASVGFTGDPFWLLNEGTKWVAAGVLGADRPRVWWPPPSRGCGRRPKP